MYINYIIMISKIKPVFPHLYDSVRISEDQVTNKKLKAATGLVNKILEKSYACLTGRNICSSYVQTKQSGEISNSKHFRERCRI